MNFFNEKKDNALIIKFRFDRLDLKVANDFKKYVKELIDQGNRNIIIDFSKIKFIDSSGIIAIISCLKYVGNNGEIVLAHLNSIVKSLFELTKMDKIFKIYDTVENALKGLKTE